MIGIISIIMLFMLLAVAGLVLAGGRAVKTEGPPAEADPPGGWPPVALIVPATGAAPDLAANLHSLLTQDYPDYQVVLVTRDLSDPATPVISSLIRDHPRARLGLSGPAQGCGQKNHSLLAGLRLVGDAPAVLAFADATRLAPPGWLRALVAPLARGKARFASGYHQIWPRDRGVASRSRAVTVLSLYLTKGISWLNHPWGGATAMERTAFEDLEVARLWAGNVVDDVSLAARLKKAGIPVANAPEAVLSTRLTGDSWREWSAWLTRQWLFLKFCLPGTWLAAGALLYLLAGLVLLSAAALLLAPLAWAPPGLTLAATLFLALLTGLGLMLKRLHPQPGPTGLWLAGFYAAILNGAWRHLLTWPIQHIRWRGLCYHTSRGGRVREIRDA